MVDILHRVGIKASSEEVYKALATRDGLADWWTTNTQGDSKLGGVIKFRFSADGREIGGFDMKVLELRPAERVLWQMIEGPAEWIGTKVSFELKQEGDYSIVLFKHAGWKEPVEFMHHCTTKWAIFLMSLKALVETGKGAPSPADVRSATGIEQSTITVRPDRPSPVIRSQAHLDEHLEMGGRAIRGRGRSRGLRREDLRRDLHVQSRLGELSGRRRAGRSARSRRMRGSASLWGHSATHVDAGRPAGCRVSLSYENPAYPGGPQTCTCDASTQWSCPL